MKFFRVVISEDTTITLLLAANDEEDLTEYIWDYGWTDDQEIQRRTVTCELLEVEEAQPHDMGPEEHKFLEECENAGDDQDKIDEAEKRYLKAISKK